MKELLNGTIEGIRLLLTGDPEMLYIIGLSLFVSGAATVTASVVGIPLGLVTGLKRFALKRLYRTVLFALMGIPPVVIGLVVFLILSRRGPLGELQLLFTPQAMIIAQFFLVLPITTGIVFGSASREAKAIDELGMTLGATRGQRLRLLVTELGSTMWLAIATAFGRAISEVGAVMIVGGNIRDRTRVMTTFIALNNSMGDFDKSIAMGLVLLLLSLFIHGIIQHFSGGRHEY